jgi:hypothetical protein
VRGVLELESVQTDILEGPLGHGCQGTRGDALSLAAVSAAQLSWLAATHSWASEAVMVRVCQRGMSGSA